MVHSAVHANSARSGLGWVLVGIVLAFAAYNIFLFWLFDIEGPPLPDWLFGLVIGAWMFQPILFAVWAALGPGPFVVRLPLVVPCLILLVSAPGIRAGFQGIERFEYVVMAIAAAVIFSATTLLLVVLRWFLGWRIEPQSRGPQTAAPRFQFDTKYLIILVTLSALALGLTSNLAFKPPAPRLFFGPEFFVRAVAVGGGFITLLILPLIAAPLYILSSRPSKRAILWALALWILMTTIVGVIWFAIEGDSPYGVALMLQLGAAIVGSLAAWALRLTGCRLRRRRATM